MWGVLGQMSTVEVGKYYWIRCDDPKWVVALRYLNTQTYVWLVVVEEGPDSPYLAFYYDTEVNEIGPEIVPPPQ